MIGETVKLSGNETLSDFERMRQEIRDNLLIDLLFAFTLGKEKGCSECGTGLADAGTPAAFNQYKEVLRIYGFYTMNMAILNKREATGGALQQPEDTIVTERTDAKDAV